MKAKQNGKLEKLTKTIQKKLDGNPVLLIGSGASIPYGLPVGMRENFSLEPCKPAFLGSCKLDLLENMES